jgi:long-subunit fatty acid transport protein
MLVGGSVDFVRSGWEINVAQVETPGRSAPSDFLSVRAAHRLRGHSTTLGMLLSYPAVNVGLVYHFPFWMDYDINHALDSNLLPPVRLVTEPGTRMRFPTSYAAGVAWRPNSEWTLAADLTRDEWSRTTVDRLPGQDRPTNFFDELPEDRTSTRDTLTLAVGAERLFRGQDRVIPLRFGFAYEPQGDMNPVTRDPVNIVLVSAGGGFNTNQLKLDLAFQVRWASSRQAVTLGVSNALEGVYDAVGVTYQREWRIKLSAIYRIADTDKLRGLLKRVFVGS